MARRKTGEYMGIAPNFDEDGQHDYRNLPDPRRRRGGKPPSISSRQDRSVANSMRKVTLPKPPWEREDA